jgi:hypothetical protein
MSIAWKNLIKSDTKKYLDISFYVLYSFFIKYMKVGNSNPREYNWNYFYKCYMFYWVRTAITRYIWPLSRSSR